MIPSSNEIMMKPCVGCPVEVATRKEVDSRFNLVLGHREQSLNFVISLMVLFEDEVMSWFGNSRLLRSSQ
jgi:hypothetical protein